MEKIKKRSKEKPGPNLTVALRAKKRAMVHSVFWSAVIFATGLVFWEAASRNDLISPVFFPPPSIILETLMETAISGKLAMHAGKTLCRMFAGLFLGALPGLALGLMLGWNDSLKAIFNPLIAAVHPIPKIAIFPLIMVIFGIGELSKIVVVAVTAFFPMLINSLAGAEQINSEHFEAAANYKASRLMIFRKVLLPGSLPMVLAGFRLALNMAMIITIAAEMVSSNDGLGAMIWLSWEIFRITELYAGIVVIAFLGISFNFILEKLARRLTPWRYVNK